MSIFTAHKRSLGQGNIFIGMCQEFCSQGVLLGRRARRHPREGGTFGKETPTEGGIPPGGGTPLAKRPPLLQKETPPEGGTSKTQCY